MGHFHLVTDSDVTVNKVFRDWLRQRFVERLLTGNCVLTLATNCALTLATNCALTLATKLLLHWTETVAITFYQIPFSRDLKSAVCQVM